MYYRLTVNNNPIREGYNDTSLAELKESIIKKYTGDTNTIDLSDNTTEEVALLFGLTIEQSETPFSILDMPKQTLSFDNGLMLKPSTPEPQRKSIGARTYQREYLQA